LNVSAEAVTVRFVPIVAAKKAISICIFTSLGTKSPRHLTVTGGFGHSCAR
jgi:hypothetical protein